MKILEGQLLEVQYQWPNGIQPNDEGDKSPRDHQPPSILREKMLNLNEVTYMHGMDIRSHIMGNIFILT